MPSGAGTRAAPLIERFGADDPGGALAVLAVHGRDQTPDFMREIASRLDDADTAWRAVQSRSTADHARRRPRDATRCRESRDGLDRADGRWVIMRSPDGRIGQPARLPAAWWILLRWAVAVSVAP